METVLLKCKAAATHYANSLSDRWDWGIYL